MQPRPFSRSISFTLTPESRTNKMQPYHTDIGDILALYTLGQAYKGGRSKLASTGAIYNELAETRPDHIDTLQSGEWIFDTLVTLHPIIKNHSSTKQFTKHNFEI